MIGPKFEVCIMILCMRVWMGFDPIAHRKAKILYNVGLSKCNRVNS